MSLGDATVEGFPRADSVYAIYDGHSGPQVALLASKKLHRYALKSASYAAGDTKAALVEAFALTESDCARLHTAQRCSAGTTAAVAIVDNERGRLHVANVGDTEALLVHRQPMPQCWQLLTRKHKPSDPDEQARIDAAGGFVASDRVMGMLAVSRALGDPSYKLPSCRYNADLVSSEPHCVSVDLHPERDLCVLLACDGFWDVVTYEQGADLVRRELMNGTNPRDAAEKLVKHALKQGTTDNVTVIVVLLHWT